MMAPKVTEELKLELKAEVILLFIYIFSWECMGRMMSGFRQNSSFSSSFCMSRKLQVLRDLKREGFEVDSSLNKTVSCELMRSYTKCICVSLDSNDDDWFFFFWFVDCRLLTCNLCAR